jgi:hypothetical protein
LPRSFFEVTYQMHNTVTSKVIAAVERQYRLEFGPGRKHHLASHRGPSKYLQTADPDILLLA